MSIIIDKQERGAAAPFFLFVRRRLSEAESGTHTKEKNKRTLIRIAPGR